MMKMSGYQARVEIREILPNDLPSIVEIHTRTFPDSAMTQLGPGTLLRYYDWQLNGPHNVHAIGAVADGTMVGFCFGGVFKSAIGGFIRRNRWYLAGQVLMRPYLLVGPLFRDRLRRGLRIVASPVKRPLERSRSFHILVIAIDPVAQKRGVGAMLMQVAEAEAVAGGFEQMHLGVRSSNQKAIRFYERLGWVRVESSTGWTESMRKDISGASSKNQPYLEAV